MALNICVCEIVELGGYGMWPFWWDPTFPVHDASPAVPLPCASPWNKRAKYLILELLHAREILGVINGKSCRDWGNWHPWDPALLGQQGGSCRSLCSCGHSTCGSWWLKPRSNAWKKTNPRLRSWQVAQKSIAFHLCSVESKCICKFESSCWRSAVNQTDFVLQNLCCLVLTGGAAHGSSTALRIAGKILSSCLCDIW